MSDNPLYKKKLIEVALPLDEINKQSARENYIYRGNPSAIHKWWAQRPLAACRAVIFAQLVDDPSSKPEDFPSEEEQARERNRLFAIMRRLVDWDNVNDAALYEEAYKEMVKSCDGDLPSIMDPFAGGGSIPLEARRLGLDVYATDLNPVAVLINKALVEIPATWTGAPPVYPGAAGIMKDSWSGVTGLAEDVRRYGRWIYDEAKKRIGCHYPKARLDDGSEVDVISWMWARTIVCPNPSCKGTTPLAGTFWLSKRKGRQRYLVPEVIGSVVRFKIDGPKGEPRDGTVSRAGAICLLCNTPIPLSTIRSQGKKSRIGAQLTAVVVNGLQGRSYIESTSAHEEAANVERPDDFPDGELPDQALGFRVQAYGMSEWSDLFTNRQLLATATFSELVTDVRKRVLADALDAGLPMGGSVVDGGAGARAYSETVGIYLAFVVSKFADYNCSLAVWYPKEDRPKNLFARQAIPMVWDYPEVNPFGDMGGTWLGSLKVVADAIPGIPSNASGSSHVSQADAVVFHKPSGAVICTDPPYYDNIAYADLSDFFYVWLRRSLGDVFPQLLGTMLTPKASELIANPYRQGGQQGATKFFEEGFESVFTYMRKDSQKQYPIAIFYAYKQSERDEAGESSTGWETLLEGMAKSGWVVTATWPIRTERGGRIRDLKSNALASSIVLTCRPRSADAGVIDRRGFISLLKAELPAALHNLQQGGVAPVDLTQAALGPGMSVFTRYSRVVEADGSRMSVKAALKLINKIRAEVLSGQEEDFDSDTRFCVKWFESYGFDTGRFGEAETLSKAMDTTVMGLERSGVLKARAGDVQLFAPAELPEAYDPTNDDRVSTWEVVMHLAKALKRHGIDAAASLISKAGSRIDVDVAQELTYRIFLICESRKWSESGLLFNELGTAWPEIQKASRVAPRGSQETFDYSEED